MLRIRSKKLAGLVGALGLMLAGPVAASASPAIPMDPTLQPGCSNASHHYDYAGPSYEATTALYFCWNGGLITKVAFHGITGSIRPNASTIFQVSNGIGPARVTGAPITAGETYGSTGAARVWFFFDSRDCATGPLHLMCSSWTTHKLFVDIRSGGASTWGNIN